MELHYGINQPLRFYETLEHQNRYRKGANDNIFKLLCPTTHLLPFQLKSNETGLQNITLINIDDLSVTNIDFQAGQFVTLNNLGYNYRVNYGTLPLTTPIAAGQYYVRLQIGSKIWYSEVITFKAFSTTLDGCALTKITYWDSCIVDDIYYPATFKNIIYLDVDIGRPQYNYVEEGEENGAGEFSADYKTLEKQYYLQLVAPEYLLDALYTMLLHSNIEVNTFRGYMTVVDSMSIDSNWEDGVWALTDILFITNKIFKTKCCSEEEAPTPEGIGGMEVGDTFIVS